MTMTNVTAAPRPMAVLTLFDTAMYEHMPKKKAKTMLSINIERIKRFSVSIIYPPTFPVNPCSTNGVPR